MSENNLSFLRNLLWRITARKSGFVAEKKIIDRLTHNVARSLLCSPIVYLALSLLQRRQERPGNFFEPIDIFVDAGGQFRSLAEPWADTATSTGRLMIAVLGGLADVERDLDPHPHSRGQEPRQGPWGAYGPARFPHPAAAGGSPPAPR